jgi:CHASE2 domain-containing sensor protein
LDIVYEVFDNFWTAYIAIFVMTAIIFRVAFVKRLPVLKAVAAYVVLAVGCYIFTIMHIFRFPVIPALAITLVIVAVARLRMIMSDRQRSE